jgi:hypothetical protein
MIFAWGYMLAMIAFLLFFFYIPTLILWHKMDSIAPCVSKSIYKQASCVIVISIIAVTIAFTLIFLSYFGHETMILKRKDIDGLAFQVELGSGMDRIFPIFLNSTDPNFSEPFEDPNCTFVDVHKLCPTWGALLHMNMTRFLRCPPYPDFTYPILQGVIDDPHFLLYTVGFRKTVDSVASYMMSGSLIIFVVLFVSYIAVIAYRRDTPVDQRFETKIIEFMKETFQDSRDGFLRPLVTSFLSNQDSIE